jgi:hydrogenase expression/formation protein HypD
MTAPVMKKLRDPALVRELGGRLHGSLLPKPATFMEVCGTHTMAIHRAGIPALLPPAMRLLSGPGCPVCVTPVEYFDTAFALARTHSVMLATFGDMVRVPGSSGSLASLRSEGFDIRVVYSPSGALECALENLKREVVFLAVGFETTAPAVAAAVLRARERGVKNFSILCAHKLVVPALAALVEDPHFAVDGFILPGHVSVVIGSEPYRFLAETHRRACVITGFEPADILQALLMLEEQLEQGEPRVAIQYARAVRPSGNVLARRYMNEVFALAETVWRGFGPIPASGLAVREEYSDFDAGVRFPVAVSSIPEPAACRCGDILRGHLDPLDCPLFGQDCTPLTPVGPCMVSSEGTCAAFYRYSRNLRPVRREAPGRA